jgi:hypothetical protein
VRGCGEKPAEGRIERLASVHGTLLTAFCLATAGLSIVMEKQKGLAYADPTRVPVRGLHGQAYLLIWKNSGSQARYRVRWKPDTSGTYPSLFPWRFLRVFLVFPLLAFSFFFLFGLLGKFLLSLFIAVIRFFGHLFTLENWHFARGHSGNKRRYGRSAARKRGPTKNRGALL